RDVKASVVRQLDAFTQYATGLGDGALAEDPELLLGQAVEVLVRGELLGRWDRLLGGGELRVRRADARPGVDIDHRGDAIGTPITRCIAGEAGAAVDSQHDRRRGGADSVDD